MYFDIFSSQSRSPSVSKWVEKQSSYNFEDTFDDEDETDHHENILIPIRVQNSPANNSGYGELNGALYKAIEKRDERIKELELSLLRFEQSKTYDLFLLC
jgi:hypothetical protein